MSTGWVVFLAIVAVVVLLSILRKPIILEGRVVKKSIAKNPNEDSFVTIESADKKFVLKFETHEVGLLIQIGGESFHDRAEELDRAIALNDVVSVESYDKYGLTRDVHKILSVSRAQ